MEYPIAKKCHITKVHSISERGDDKIIYTKYTSRQNDFKILAQAEQPWRLPQVLWGGSKTEAEEVTLVWLHWCLWAGETEGHLVKKNFYLHFYYWDNLLPTCHHPTKEGMARAFWLFLSQWWLGQGLSETPSCPPSESLFVSQEGEARLQPHTVRSHVCDRTVLPYGS